MGSEDDRDPPDLVVSYVADLWAIQLLTTETIFGIQSPIVSFAAANQYQEILYLLANQTKPPPKPSFTECAVYFCEKEFSSSTYSATDVSGDFLNIARTQQLIINFTDLPEQILDIDLYPPAHHLLLADLTLYLIEPNVCLPLRHTLSNIFNSTPSDSGQDSPQPGSLSLTALLRNGDLDALLQGVSTSLTNNLRANPGLANKVYGSPYQIEAYIHVRWPWIIFPACVVLDSVILLLSSAIVNKRQDNMLWKSSVLPLLMSGLELAPGHKIWNLRSMDEMQRISENIHATMHREEGRPVFTEG